MRFKDREQFINYAQFIPLTFLVIWILSFAYVLYSAPSYPDEISGRIYVITIKSKTIYISLFEEILVCGSAIGMALSFVILQAVAFSRKDKNNHD